ncbi:MAG: ABC transporter ATP-binding protein [Actinomycetota bacterium]
MTVLEVRDLSVTYRTQAGEVPAARNVNLSIDRGEVLGLAGESGCGKSTIAHALLRLLPEGTKTSGEVLLDGEDVLTMNWGALRAVRWDRASIVFQGAMHALNPVRRVGDQIAEAIQLHDRLPPKKSEWRVKELIEQVGLPPRSARDFPHELSGGQRQRIMVAMALACKPDLVIADEPTTALDVMIQAQVLNLIQTLQVDLGLSMLFITHDLSVMVDVCDRIAVMYAGEIIEEGPARAVFDSPVHPYSKALSGAFPRVGEERFRGAPLGLGGDPPDPARLPSGCSFHPRCSEAFAECSKVDPSLYHAGPGRRAACLLVRSKDAVS